MIKPQTILKLNLKFVFKDLLYTEDHSGRENPESTQMKNALFIFEENVAFIFAGLDLCVCVCV